MCRCYSVDLTSNVMYEYDDNKNVTAVLYTSCAASPHSIEKYNSEVTDESERGHKWIDLETSDPIDSSYYNVIGLSFHDEKLVKYDTTPLNFDVESTWYDIYYDKYIDNKNGKEVNTNIYLEFESFIRNGGFPGTIVLDNDEDKRRYTKNILDDIFEKDIKTNEKIKNAEMFKNVQNYVINNFGSITSASSISKFYESQNINIDIRTIERYIDILVNAKIIIPCDLFDIKSKISLKGEKKYYLADLSLYFVYNTDNRINYGPVLENILHNYLLSKDYSLSVGRIGKLECDFIARQGLENYYYLQVSKNIDEEKTETREYKPFFEIKDLYPRYLFVFDFPLQKNVKGIHNINIVDFIYNNEDLKSVI